MKIESASLIAAAALACGTAFAAENPAAYPKAAPISSETNDTAFYVGAGASYAGMRNANSIVVNGNTDQEIGIGTGTAQLFGGEINGGATFGETDLGFHQVDFSTGILGGSQRFSIFATEFKNTYRVIPLVLSYNYNFKVCQDTVVYVGPRVGALIMKQDVELVNFPANSSHDTQMTYVAGINVGVKYQITHNFGLDVGYAYEYVGAVDFQQNYPGLAQVESRLKQIGINTVRIGATYRF